MNLEAEIMARLADARIAARRLALVGSDRKNRALGVLADALQSSTDRILTANREDVVRAQAAGEAPAFVERLTLSPDRSRMRSRPRARNAARLAPAGALPDASRA